MKLPVVIPTCEYEGCPNFATEIAAGRKWFDDKVHPLGFYCEPHASAVANEGHPEYIADCPNCGCQFGVN